MGKHAYLIIAHNNFYILEKLLLLLDDERNDIYLHIDKKVKKFDFDKYKFLLKKSNLFYTERINVKWGNESQVECELILLKEAMAHSKYDYYHLLSGVDLPLKSQSYIHSFFDNYITDDIQFIHFSKLPYNEGIYDRVLYKHYDYNFRSNNKIVHIFNIIIDRIFVKIQKTFKIRKKLPADYKIRYGANWFSITDSFAKYLLSKNRIIKQIIKKSLCADEIFLQTIFYNSPYKDKLYNKDYNDNYDSIKRFIDWNRGSPYIFREYDYDELVASNMLFARKFDSEIDKKIIDKIYYSIINN